MNFVEPSDPILHEKMPLFEGRYGAPLKPLINEMWNMMRQGRSYDDGRKRVSGIGLAAPQVGVRLRLFIMHMNPHRGRFKDLGYVCINPSWEPMYTQQCQAAESMFEGCLTWPGESVKKDRWRSIIARWNDLRGNHHCEELHGLVAQCFQHELDHLDGVTIF